MTAPTTLEQQVRWLVDRAAITDLILDFARCVDDQDSAGYAANFAVDGELVLPFTTLRGRDAIAAMPGPPASWATQHLVGNIVIDLDGDVARTRAWMMATHVFDRADPRGSAHAGGWYTHEVVRTPEGWRLRRVELTIVWEGDTPMIPEGEHLG